jgi:hypothetical protein
MRFFERENAQAHLANITATFSGAILRKAEFEDNFDKVYSRVVEKMVEFEFIELDDGNVLELLGMVGG